GGKADVEVKHIHAKGSAFRPKRLGENPAECLRSSVCGERWRSHVAAEGSRQDDTAATALAHQRAIVPGKIRLAENIDGNYRLGHLFGQFYEHAARTVRAGVIDEQTYLNIV